MAKRLRLLIVEDSEDDAFLIKRELIRGGYEVTLKQVDTSVALYSALEQEPWDIVLSDYNLPGFDGLAALKVVRQHGIDLPFILVSGAIGEEIAVDAMKLGAQDYIKKDNLSRLVPAVERELREAQIRQERKQVEEKLVESEARYRKLVENIPIGIYRLSPEPPAKILMSNPAFIHMLGFENPEELNHTSLKDLYNDPAEAEDFFQTIQQDGTKGFDVRLKRKDGGLLWGFVTARPGTDENGQATYFDCTIEDITERRQAEKIREALYLISQAANTAQNLEDLFQQVHKIVGGLMPANNFYLALYDPAQNTISFPYYVDEFDTPPSVQELGKGLTDYVIRSGQPLLASPELFRKMVEAGEIEIVGTPAVDWLGVPLKTAENQAIGALVVQIYNEGIRYTEHDKEVLTFVSSQAAMAIERKRTEDALRSSEARQRGLLDAVPDLIIVFDEEGKFLDYRLPEATLKYISQPLLGKKIPEILPLDIASRIMAAIHQALRTQKTLQLEHELTLPGENQSRIFEARISVSGENQVLFLIRDVTEQRQSRQKLEEQRLFLRQVVDINPNLIFAKDQEGHFTLVNQTVADIYGTTVENLIGKKDSDFNINFHEVEAFRHDDIEVIQTLQQKVVSEEMITDASGKVRYLQTVKRPLLAGETGEVQVLGVATDITDRKRAETQLLHNALHDMLTGLPNRALFLDRLERAMERGRRHPNALFAVLMLDFDRFARVNDSLGHAVGDHLLIAASGRLESCLRTADTIARIGGDEFIILLEDINNVSDVTQVAERLLEEMTVPFNLLGQKVIITTSIGVVLGSLSYDKPEDILRDADIAMYRAKSQGRGRYTMFSSMMRADVVAHLELETDIRQAIERKELVLYYQPIMNLKKCKITGFEALVRWLHPKRGLIAPDEFIPFAEETGLIIPLGEWILTEACQQLRTWHKTQPALKDATVSVNLSSKQFSQPNLANQVENILKDTDLEPQFLRLEITESNLMENAEFGIAALKQLRSLGVQIDVDDFGTGYSSLVYLHQLPLNAIKIDRSFISGSVGSADGMRIVQSIIRLAQDLKMETVAEGVENLEQIDQLQKLGCDYIQGYLLAKGFPNEMIEQFVSVDIKRINGLCRTKRMK
jgi:diguanylate cyclase (GGDEF)-like protein/PAS domain S-box-containing protein